VVRAVVTGCGIYGYSLAMRGILDILATKGAAKK